MPKVLRGPRAMLNAPPGLLRLRGALVKSLAKRLTRPTDRATSSGMERLRERILADEAAQLFEEGMAADERFDYTAAHEAFTKALPLYQQIGDVRGEANCIFGFGDIAFVRSDHAGARDAYKRALPLYQQIGDVRGEANCIFGLGDIAFARSDHAGARDAYERALPLYQQIGDVFGEASCILVCIPQCCDFIR